VKEYEAVLICSFSSRFFSQIAPLSSLEEAGKTEVLHSQPGARTERNRTCSDCRGEQQGKSLLLNFKQRFFHLKEHFK